MADQFVCDTKEVRDFIGRVKEVTGSTHSVHERLAALRPVFGALMADPDWLPAQYRRSYERGGMGTGVASWLLYRDTGGMLSLSVLALSPGAATPVHDHLAWGLVGLYAGEQDEEVYQASTSVGPETTHAELRLVTKNRLLPGSFYELIPPAGDIHRVITVGPETSISLHLLGNDVGCVDRHRFEPDTGAVAAFRSGYANQACEPHAAGKGPPSA